MKAVMYHYVRDADPALDELMRSGFGDESELASGFYLSVEQTHQLHEAA